MVRVRRKRRVTRIRLIVIAVLCIAAAAAVLLGLFRIHTVELYGSSRYQPEQIKNDLITDFWTENTLYFSWKYRNAVSDPKAPYLESIQAKVLTPGKVRLTVKEKILTGYVQYAGNNVYFDRDGEVLEITDTVYGDVPLVSGVTMSEPVLYQRLPMENAAQMGAMLKIASLLIQEGFMPDNISFDENLNITLTIDGITVKLGQNDYLDEKVANLVNIYPQLQGQTGTLNMDSFTGKNEDISFLPSDEAPVQETEAGSGEGTASQEGASAADPEGQGDGNEDGSSEGSGQNEGGSDQTGEDAQGAGQENAPEDSQGASQENTPQDQEATGVVGFMVFDSSGTLRYDARVVNGQVVDAGGNPIDGCTVNEAGNVVDAYWNEIDPMTGQAVNLGG